MLRKISDQSSVKFDERSRRACLWNDALREISISADKLYIFLRTLSGTLHESVDTVIEVNDSTVQSAHENDSSRQYEAMRKFNEFSNKIMGIVFSSVLTSARLDFNLDGGGDVVVVSRGAVEDVRKLAESESGLGYWEAGEKLQRALNSSQSCRLSQLMQNISLVLQSLREQQTAAAMDASEPLRSSFEYLAAPRNSFTVRLKAEASAAIKTAWCAFEIEYQRNSPFAICPSAYDVIESEDSNLRTAFATYAAYTMSHSRIFSSSSAVYVTKTAAAQNMSMMRIALVKLVRRAIEYQTNPRKRPLS
jgi:hypothetical protein